jgi:hypothetical protein
MVRWAFIVIASALFAPVAPQPATAAPILNGAAIKNAVDNESIVQNVFYWGYRYYGYPRYYGYRYYGYPRYYAYRPYSYYYAAPYAYYSEPYAYYSTDYNYPTYSYPYRYGWPYRRYFW